MLILNMTMVSIVVIAAFSVIYIITYVNVQEENKAKIEAIPKLPSIVLGSPYFYDQQSGEVERRIVFRIPVEYSQSFIGLVRKEGEIIDIYSYIDLPEEVFRNIVGKAWQTGKTNGTLSFDNRKWQYNTSSLGDKLLIREYEGHQEVIDNSDYFLISFIDITDSSYTLTRLLITLFVVGIIVIFIFFGVSFYFANRSIGPIEEYWQKQKQFVADASHELKTPLAIISANTDALLANSEDTVHSQKKWVNYIQSETDRMSKLVNDMLYLAKVEDIHETQMPFDLSGTVLNAIASMEAIIYENGIQLTQKIAPGIFVLGDEEKIKQTVLILLDNAIKYVNEHGTINVELNRFRNNAVFSIQNSGEGIPTDKLQRVFDRFYRCDPSRAQETGGYGLGLSIAKAVIERSGGSISAESSDGSTTFSFELKLL